MKKAIFAYVVCAGLMSSAWGVPTQWSAASGGNNHWYEWIQMATNWDKARAAALASSFNGQPGYLATLTSADESAFVGAIIAQGTNVYVGGSDAAVEGEWRWLDGPEAGNLFTYTNWNAGEPNDLFGIEDVLHINYERLLGWNDIPATLDFGYVVEYSAVPTAISSPATWALILPALMAAAWASRRR